MTFIQLVAISGLVCAGALVVLGLFGWGRRRWWGIGRLGRVHAVLMGVALGLLNVQWVVTLPDTTRIAMAVGSLVLVITVLFARLVGAQS